MAKVLWRVEPGTLECQQYIIDTLIKDGHQVIVECSDNWNRFLDPLYFKKHDDARYDFAVYTIHVGNPKIANFVRSLSCKQNFIMAHDLFNPHLEGVWPPGPGWNNKKLIVFTKAHEKIAHQCNQLNTVQARWYKLDMPYEVRPENADALQNAIIIDQSCFDPQAAFKYSPLFKNVYLKLFSPNKSTFLEAPKDIIGIKGFKDTARLGKFWFIRESSMYVEALMVGCLPICFEGLGTSHWITEFPYIRRTIKKNDITSRIILNIRTSETTIDTLEMTSITCENLGYKIEKLQKDSSLFKATLEELSLDWLFPTPLKDLPSVAEILKEQFCEK